MTVRQYEWTQRTWERAGQHTYHSAGDLYNLVGLYPDPTRTKLKRAPKLNTHVDWPSGFADPEGAIFDEANANYVFYGMKTSNSHLATVYYTQAWSASAIQDLTVDVSTYGALCGHSQRNIHHWAGKIYLITDNFDVYAGSSYTAAPSKLWDATGGLSARLLLPYGDRMYFIETGGDVYRLDADAAGFSPYYEPIAPLDFRFATAFHQYLCLVSRTEGGILAIHRLPDVNPFVLHEVATVTGTTGSAPKGSPFTNGSLYLTHRDRVFFTSGWYVPTAGDVLDVYAFNGSYIERIAQITGLPAIGDVAAAGLAVWHDELLFWYARTDSTAQRIMMLVGDSFVDFIELSATHSSYSCLYALSGELCFVAKDGSANEGFWHTSGLQDGYLITPWLDFDTPSHQKRLNRITVLTDTADADLDIIIKYKIDDDTSWTTATTSTNTKVNTTDPHVQLRRLQLRIEIDDDSGSDLDAGIDALSVLYAVNR